MTTAYGDLVDPALMAASFERGVEVCVEDLKGEVVGDESGREDEDVGVVVLLCEGCELREPAESGADALMFVERHLDTVAGTAHCDTEVALSGLDGEGTGVGKIGVVA